MSDTKTVELNVGTIIDDRYKITGRIGRGGMGTVYESEQVTLQRSVALKVLRPEFAEKETAAKRFEREAKAASSIDHRNVVNILDFGHLPSGELYYTMERLQGRDLSQVLREGGALPWSRAGWIILQVVRAFGAIHAQGIVHRDIKPANCFLIDPKAGDEPDFVKILDFGIANLQDDRTKATALTGAADIVGSVRYMAPEQIAAESVDARTDIYSLGVMMYELVTGRVPFSDSSVFKVMIAHQQEAPRSPREFVPDLPAEAEAIILRAMAKQPTDRFQSMQEIEAALLPMVVIPGTLGGNTTTPRLTGAALAFPPPPSRGTSRWLIPVLAFAILFIGAIIVTRWLKKSEQTDSVANSESALGDGGGTGAAQDGDVTPTRSKTLLIEPPPEEQYDPFADPFGAPSLKGRTIRRPGGSGGGDTDGDADALPDEEVPLEEILPPEPWTLEPGTISGTVYNDKERPLAKAGVCAWIIDPRAPAELRKRPICARTDRRGHFELHKVLPGIHDVHVSKQKFLPQSYLAVNRYPIALQPGGEQEGLEFVLEPGGVELRGTIKTKLGDPIRGAKVAVVGGPRTLAVADNAGTFALWVSQPEVSVVAWANGYADVVAQGNASTPLDVVLPIQAKIFGLIVDADTDEPIVRARVRAGRVGPGVSPLTYTGEDGGFTFAGLSEGSYRPTGRTDDAYGEVREAFKVQAGTATPEVVIKLRRFKIEQPEPEPEPEFTDSTGDGDAGTTGSTGGTDTSTTGETDTSGSSSGDPDSDSSGDTGGAGDEPVPADDPPEPTEPTPSSPTTAEPSKPKPPSDKSLRRKLAKKLKKCGKDGKIEVTAKLVVASGELLQESVKVKGAAAKDKSVKKCAEAHVAKFKLTKRKSPSEFKRLEVTLDP